MENGCSLADYSLFLTASLQDTPSLVSITYFDLHWVCHGNLLSILQLAVDDCESICLVSIVRVRLVSGRDFNWVTPRARGNFVPDVL